LTFNIDCSLPVEDGIMKVDDLVCIPICYFFNFWKFQGH